MKIAVVDIGGTSIKYSLAQNGGLSEVLERDTNAKLGGEQVISTVIEALGGLQGFDRIGVSTAGQVDSERGVIVYANENIPGYTGMDIRGRLSERFSVPVAVENDVNSASLGEAHFGAGRSAKGGSFVCLTYGTGVGGAVVMGGEVYKGANGVAGEFGMTITHGEDRVEGDELSGCYERYASTTALVRMAMAQDKTLVNGREIFKRIDEPRVRVVIDGWIGEIVLGLTSIVHIFNPSMIVLGGGIMNESYITERLEGRLLKSVMPSFRELTLARAQLGNRAGLMGAGYIAEKL